MANDKIYSSMLKSTTQHSYENRSPDLNTHILGTRVTNWQIACPQATPRFYLAAMEEKFSPQLCYKVSEWPGDKASFVT